jgi:hypothetical protein
MKTTRTNHLETTLPVLLSQIQVLRKSLQAFAKPKAPDKAGSSLTKRFVAESGSLVDELHRVREQISPVRFGAIGITLGRSDSIAKFFAFSFTNQKKRALDTLVDAPFYGAGVYAIYYHGKTEMAYRPLSCTETPIYVGKADPKNSQAETVEEQGQALYSRLREHSKNMAKANLPLADFYYRAAPIQTGMQTAVEDFMIRLFRPIWNREIKICFGLGKHGDNASTRANRRSPWDTMHPGRTWAAATKADQMNREEIETRIADHFGKYPVIPNKDKLFKLLSLG